MRKMEEYFILFNIANLKENMKPRSDELKQQLEKQDAKIELKTNCEYAYMIGIYNFKDFDANRIIEYECNTW